MSRLELDSPKKARIVMEELYKDLERRIESSPSGLCPVDMSRSWSFATRRHAGNACRAVSGWGS